jgi:hypothetical protein
MLGSRRRRRRRKRRRRRRRRRRRGRMCTGALRAYSHHFLDCALDSRL